MATVTSRGGHSSTDPSTWPLWVCWRGPRPADPRLTSIGEEDEGSDTAGHYRHRDRVRQWMQENLPTRPRPGTSHQEWERRTGVGFWTREAAEMRPDDYPFDD
ncbi:hypothetical protein [Rhodococcus sp. IEGM 1408]|uniref:hypothetical protein n=1 Tax=Rhodococcus sp. IEGM 1408 TaxID=3082220 RepID=UPI0029538D6A|nr:hypothetical protein [Rhodococcus sp. IEGM 1408]MDV8000371.1 hypothetical protein [Rhodococcus sp. IEGM 1408]